jgi:5-formyltetrahydrofolate cyclo-ligase
VTLAKADLRSQARKRRKALATAAPGAAELAAANLPPGLLGAVRAASVYLPMRFELDPGPLARRLERMGIAILLPAVVERGAPLLFREACGALAEDAAGLPAPPPDAAVRQPDLVILPLLAFDASGYRLGWGGGYYDRTLAILRSRGPTIAVGLAFAGQEVESVPREAHDQRLDGVLTEVGYRSFLC